MCGLQHQEKLLSFGLNIKEIDYVKTLDGKVVVITGVAGGIGSVTAILFAKEGARIVGSDIDEEGGNTIAAEIRASGGSMTFVKANISKEEDIKGIFKIAHQFGGVDILFNNAGIEGTLSLLDTSENDWNNCIDVNLKSVFFCSKYAIPQMKEKKKGVIINSSSVAGLQGSFSPSYSAAKGGVVALTKALASDFGEHNIRVNCICPGAIESPMLERVTARQGDRKEIRAKRMMNYPLGRFGYPEEVAKVALFLASDESSFITGQAIVIDGGFTTR
ncbi:SDR family oxidoreductase [Candidatus Thorarchaeota archaeon]|nr:MAG: SDR family oxidoreductase [Candidatus Thorarchaeota archaeon]